MFIMTTSGDTHSPESWADIALYELVPLQAGASADLCTRTLAARNQLRPAVVESLVEIREHERKALSSLSDRDYTVLKRVIHGHHGHPDRAGEEITRMENWTRGKVLGHDDWLDRCVSRVCGAVMSSDGDKVGHNEMVDKVYNVLGQYVRSLQFVERSHHVTQRDPVPPCWGFHKGGN